MEDDENWYGGATGMHNHSLNWDVEKASKAHADFLAADRVRHQAVLAERKRKRDAAKGKSPTAQTTDYPWLKPDWVEAPVRPFKRL